ncbi:hypothetical protein KLP42_04245 [Rhizobium sp. CSW-27]|nr:hypothetical protein [Rhizobium sp. CSW-27]
MQPEQDAKGQFGKSQADRKASGVAAAKPTVITHSEDSTAHNVPPGQAEPKRPAAGAPRWDSSESTE